MLAKRLKELRKAEGLSQQKLAEQLYIHAHTYGMYERGICSPSADTIARIARFYDCTNDYLLGASDARTTNPDAKDKIIQELTAECNELKKQIKETNVALSKVVDIYHALSGRHSA